MYITVAEQMYPEVKCRRGKRITRKVKGARRESKIVGELKARLP